MSILREFITLYHTSFASAVVFRTCSTFTFVCVEYYSFKSYTRILQFLVNAGDFIKSVVRAAEDGNLGAVERLLRPGARAQHKDHLDQYAGCYEKFGRQVGLRLRFGRFSLRLGFGVYSTCTCRVRLRLRLRVTSFK